MPIATTRPARRARVGSSTPWPPGDSDGGGWYIDRWNGSKYVTVTQSAAMSFTRAGNVLDWTVSKADLGGTTGFGFYVWSSSWDSSDAKLGEDEAPDDGAFVSRCQPCAPASTTTTTPAQQAVKPVIAVRSRCRSRRSPGSGSRSCSRSRGATPGSR